VEPRPLRLLEPDAAGQVDVAALNVDIPAATLADPRTPRWVAKPTVAYLWARTVRCKACRATIPLLKTRWLCRTAANRVRLLIEPNKHRDGVDFVVDTNVPIQGSSAAARRAADKRLGYGTMSRGGAKCPCCPVRMTMEEIRFEGQAKRLGVMMTAVSVDAANGKEFRRPTEHEIAVAEISDADLKAAYAEVPFGMPIEPTPKGGGGVARAFSVGGYGLTRWADLSSLRHWRTTPKGQNLDFGQLRARPQKPRIWEATKETGRDHWFKWRERCGRRRPYSGITIGRERVRRAGMDWRRQLVGN
jgi:putative DNA methylase